MALGVCECALRRLLFEAPRPSPKAQVPPVGGHSQSAGRAGFRRESRSIHTRTWTVSSIPPAAAHICMRLWAEPVARAAPLPSWTVFPPGKPLLTWGSLPGSHPTQGPPHPPGKSCVLTNKSHLDSPFRPHFLKQLKPPDPRSFRKALREGGCR